MLNIEASFEQNFCIHHLIIQQSINDMLVFSCGHTFNFTLSQELVAITLGIGPT